MKRFNTRRLFNFGRHSILRVLTIAALLGFTAPTVMAAAPALAFTCPTSGDCFFSGDNETGNHRIITASTHTDAWYMIDPAYRVSASNKSIYNLWILNNATDTWACIPSNARASIGQAGWYFINGGGGCKECPLALTEGETCPAPPQHICLDQQAADASDFSTIVGKSLR